MPQKEKAARTTKAAKKDEDMEKFLIILRWIKRHGSEEIMDDISTVIVQADLVPRRAKQLHSREILSEFVDEIEHGILKATNAKWLNEKISKLLNEFKGMQKLKETESMFPSEENLIKMFDGKANYIETMQVIHFAFLQLFMHTFPA